VVDRRYVLRGLLLGTAAAALPAGCGVPTSGRPVVDAPASAGGPDTSGGSVPPAGPEGVTEARDLVTRFLTAVAGDLGDKRKDKARAFLTPAARQAWQPTDQVTVVRATVSDPSTASGAKGQTVTVDLQPIGVLAVTDNSPGSGSLDLVPPVPRRLEFTVVDAGANTPDNVFKLIDAITFVDAQKTSDLDRSLLLSVEGLRSGYLPQLLYFWDGGNQGLVPDLRYLPQVNLSDDGRPTWIVRALLGGPVGWLSPAAVGPPGDTQLKLPSVVRKDNALIVDLDSTASAADLSRLMDQLRWSLRRISADPDAPVVLKIAGQTQSNVDGHGRGYLDRNLADHFFRDANPTGYGITAGRVRALRDPDSPPPVLRTERNVGVTSAAVHRNGILAALVVGTPGRRALRILQSDSTGVAPRVSGDVPLPSGEPSRAMWIPNTTPPLLLYAVGGQLYATTVPVVPGSTIADDVSAFAVSPDGVRVALVTTGGGLRLATLSSAGGTVTVGRKITVDTAGLTDVRAVAWTRLERVVIAGRLPGGRYGLFELSIDGVYASKLPAGGTGESAGVFDDQITQVVAYPPLPSVSLLSGPVMLQTTSSGAWLVRPGDVAERLTFEYTSGAPPSPSPGGGPAEQQISSPFFQD